jgi:hypothetical protein
VEELEKETSGFADIEIIGQSGSFLKELHGQYKLSNP